eukprot:COSAG05_NODE_14291_length_401_cov_1.344371_1_plen_51_part_10
MAGWQPYISCMQAALNPCIQGCLLLNSCRWMGFSVIQPASQPRACAWQIWL